MLAAGDRPAGTVVPPWPIDPVNVSVTTAGVGPVSPVLVLDVPLFVQPNDAIAATSPSANVNWRMTADRQQKPDR